MVYHQSGERPTADCLRRYLDSADISIAVRALGSDDGDLLVAVWLEALKLVERQWGAITALPAILQKRGRIGGDELVVTGMWPSACGPIASVAS